jgi:hypothetical protein
MRRHVRAIAISGLVALAAVLGGVAIPVTAMAQEPTAAVRPTPAVRTSSIVAMQAALAAAAGTAAAVDGDGADAGPPMISCVLTTDCLGIKGSSSLSSGGAPSAATRVARWNGSSWKGVGVRLPKGTKSDDLNAVSCKGAKSCLAVGDYYTSTGSTPTSHALALTYNGTSLRPTPTVPAPKGLPYVALTGVSCVTTRYCVAVGTASSPPFGITFNDSATIIETWNGAKWTLHTITTPTTKIVEIDGVSCATSAFCVVTGMITSLPSSSFSSHPYVALWNGKKLTTMKPAVVGSSSDLVEPDGVSCATPSSCAVTGTNQGSASSGSTATASGFTEIWNGKAWKLATVTWPAGIAASALVGVSCYAAQHCEAVGADLKQKSAQAAAVSYNGTAGAVLTVPAPPKGDSSIFDYVSCLPWASCVAVGQKGKTSASPSAALTGVWNGKAWKLYPGF